MKRTARLIEPTLRHRKMKPRGYAEGGAPDDLPDVGSPAIPSGPTWPGTAIGNKAADIGSKLGYGAMQGLVTLPKRAIDAAAQDAQHFGEEGYEPQSIGPAMDTALTMVGGAGVVPAEANALRTGIGVMARGPQAARLTQFERLEGKGASPEMNHSMTGWYRGGDEKPRYWLSDQGAKLTDKVQELQGGNVAPPSVAWREAAPGSEEGTWDAARLGDIWDHPKLFEAYPWLKNIKVHEEVNPGWSGHYDPATGDIHVAQNSPEKFEDILHHEVVHAIQHHESFANGGNPDEFMPQDFQPLKEQFRTQAIELQRLAEQAGIDPNSAASVATKPSAEMTQAERATHERLQNAGLVGPFQILHEAARQIVKIEGEASQRYLHLHGESEARDAPFLRRNPDRLQPGKIPLHVNPEVAASGREIEVRPPFAKAGGGGLSLTPVDGDPFAAPAGQPNLTPVDHDPFAAAPAEPAPSWTDQAVKGAKGLARGAASFAGDMGQAVMGPFGPQHHAAHLMHDVFGVGPEPQMDPEYGQQISQKLGVEDKKPGYAGSIGEMLGNPSTYFGPGGLLTKAVMGAASGAGGEAAAQAAEGTGYEGLARIGGSLLGGPLAARTLKPQLAPAQQRLADSGITQMTPGQLTGGILKDAEDKLTSIPILGHFIQNARTRSVEGFNRSVANQALEPIGEALERRTAAGHDTITEVHDKLDNAYNHIVPNLTLRPDPQWFQDLRNIYNRNVQMLPQDHQQQFQRIINQEFGRPGAPLAGAQVKVIESNLNRLGRKFSGSQDANQQLLGEALNSTLMAVRSNMERMNPAFAQELQRINQGWAMYARMRVAASNRRGSEGVFTPGDLLTAVKRGDQSVQNGSFARGDALMQRFAEAGQRVLPSKVPDSGTAGRSLASIVTGGGLGYLSPKVLAGVGAASTPYLRPSMALLNRYVRPTAATPGLAGARARYSDVGRGMGSLRPLLQGNPFGGMPNPFGP